jgi:hypothetical protein
MRGSGNGDATDFLGARLLALEWGAPLSYNIDDPVWDSRHGKSISRSGIMVSKMMITCTGCNKESTGPVTLQGKTIKCKACGTVFTVPAATGITKAGGEARGGKSKPEPVMEVEAAEDSIETFAVKAAEEEDEDGPAKNPYGITEVKFAPRCPNCAEDMEEGDVVCLHCGYNIETREKFKTVKTVELTPGDWILWLLPGIACVLADLFMIAYFLIHHYLLPRMVFDKQEYPAWSKELGEHGRFAAAGSEALPFYSYLFHPGIETWIVVMILFFGFLATRFAVRRLILHPTPPEKFKR